MWFSFACEDIENSLALRQNSRADHLARLQELKSAGRLLIAGPNPAVAVDNPEEAGFTGSIIIADFDSLEQAQAWADADPYLIAGVYKSVMVKPFKKVLP
jgi:hypothetical protein